MKQNIYKVFNHNKEYISKYIYDYDTIQEHTLEESEETDNIDRQIELLNENDKILKVFIESLIQKLITKNKNEKNIGYIFIIISFIISIFITIFIGIFNIPNFMCFCMFIIGISKQFDNKNINDLKELSHIIDIKI